MNSPSARFAPATASLPGRTAVMTASRVLEWEDCAQPEARRGHLVIRTIRSLISPGTELALWNGTHAALHDPANHWAKYPFRPGYAAVGEVIAIGAGIAGHTLGQRIAFAGAHAAFASVDPATALLAVLPDGADADLACFARLLQIASSARDRLPAEPGPVVVLGAGLIGLCAALWLRAEGIAATIEDPDADRRALANACGLDAREPDAAEGPGAIIDATGIAAAIPRSLARVRRNGTVVLLGSPRVPVELDVYRHIHSSGAALVGCHECCMPAEGPASRRQRFIQAAARIAASTIDVRPLLSRTINPGALGHAYDALTRREPGWLGIVLEWNHG